VGVVSRIDEREVKRPEDAAGLGEWNAIGKRNKSEVDKLV
jgi:hypothetical protein